VLALSPSGQRWRTPDLNRSQLWSRLRLILGPSTLVRRSLGSGLVRCRVNLAHSSGHPRTKIRQLVMRRSSVRIRQGALLKPQVRCALTWGFCRGSARGG
jgi:hypothetical protein